MVSFSTFTRNLCLLAWKCKRRTFGMCKMCPEIDLWCVGTITRWKNNFALSWEPPEQLVVWLPWKLSMAWKQFYPQRARSVFNIALSEEKLDKKTSVYHLWRVFLLAAKTFYYEFRGRWPIERKQWKRVRTKEGGGSMTGVGLGKGGGGSTVASRKGLKCLGAQKMELSLCQGRISFHRDWLLNNTRSRFLPGLRSASACQSLSFTCFFPISALECGGQKKGRTRRGACGIMWEEQCWSVGRGIVPTRRNTFFVGFFL